MNEREEAVTRHIRSCLACRRLEPCRELAVVAGNFDQPKREAAPFADLPPSPWRDLALERWRKHQ